MDCPACAIPMMGKEYPYGHPARYDGVSEWVCPECGARLGRWSGVHLANDEYEERYGGWRKD